MKKAHASCLVIGDINIDFSIQATAFPPEGGEAHVEHSDYRLGGSGCTTALMLQIFGIPTSLAANTGADVFADLAMKHIHAAGLDTSLIHPLPDQQTGFFMVLVTPPAQRTMFGKRGANSEPHSKDELVKKVHAVDHLHISGYSLIEDAQYAVVSQVIKQAKQNGKTVSLDPGVCAAEQIKKRILSLLPHIDYFIPNDHELEALTNGMQESDRSTFLLDNGCGALVLKQAERGSCYMDSRVRIQVPAICVGGQTVNDSTSAGDSFNAGFLYGILTGSMPERALQIGNAAGYAMITTQHGVLDLIYEKDVKKRILHLSDFL